MSTTSDFDAEKLQKMLHALGQAPLSVILEACAGEGLGPPYDATWIQCLKNVYGSRTTPPTADEYADAIYSVWGSPTNFADWSDRVSYTDMNAGLTGVDAYTSSQVTAAANINFLEISIAIDTVGLLANYESTGQTDAGAYIKMSDNHPSEGTDEGGSELWSDSVIPNMTIHWTATSSSKLSDEIELTGFYTDKMNIFLEIAEAPTPFPGQANQYVTRANATIPPDVKTNYRFDFKVNDCQESFWWDPHIGD